MNLEFFDAAELCMSTRSTGRNRPQSAARPLLFLPLVPPASLQPHAQVGAHTSLQDWVPCTSPPTDSHLGHPSGPGLHVPVVWSTLEKKYQGKRAPAPENQLRATQAGDSSVLGVWDMV